MSENIKENTPDQTVEFEGTTYYVLANVGYSLLLVITEDDFNNRRFPMKTLVIPNYQNLKIN